jgi:hypothetical protein
MRFGLIIGFTEHLHIQLVTTSKYNNIPNSDPAFHYSTHLSLLSLMCLHQFYGNGLQWRTFPFLWVPELFPCLSQQFLTATAHKD